MPTNKQRRDLAAARATLNRPPPDEPRHPPTDDQRRIIAAARATLERRPPEPDEPVAEPGRYKTAEPMRYKTHWPAPFEPEPDTMPPQPEAPAPVDWAAYIEQRIEQERTFMIAVVGEALGQAEATIKAERKKADAALTLEITRLKCVCDELRIALGAERRGTVLDLPALPRRDHFN